MLKYVLKQIKLMELMIQINAYKYVHLESMLKMIQECACMNVLKDHSLIIMFVSVLLFVLQHLIYMDNL